MRYVRIKMNEFEKTYLKIINEENKQSTFKAGQECLNKMNDLLSQLEELSKQYLAVFGKEDEEFLKQRFGIDVKNSQQVIQTLINKLEEQEKEATN